jgi:branched-chain amino acid transport system ATP-binding protein
VIVVEHNIEFIAMISDRVVVMHRGAVIADGPIDEVRADREVQASYLGRRG